MRMRVRSCTARSLIWGLRRNPLYLLSAACMAVGARLYLVSPDTYAGDVGVILLTLGVLQTYEWAVLSVLLLLKRFSRAPEDQGSLLLIGAIFWTGPLVATVELAAEDVRLGMLLGVAVAVFGLLELAYVPRRLGLSLSVCGRVLAALCLVFLVVAPLRLRVTDDAGTDELFLYGCWWILATLTLLALGMLHERAKRPVSPAGGFTHPHTELLFVFIVIAAGATHLVAMNYAFVGHARLFYAAPVLLAVALAVAEYLARCGLRGRWPQLLVVGLPLLALLGSAARFDHAVPVDDLPWWLRKPLLSSLALAAMVWWFGAWRLRSATLFHLGSAALAAVVWYVDWRMAGTTAPRATALTLPALQKAAALAFGAATAYLLLVGLVRRARVDIAMALVTLQFAVVCAALRRPDAMFIIGTVALWSALGALHLHRLHPRIGGVLVVAGALVVLSWTWDARVDTALFARLSTAALAAVFLLVGLLHRFGNYRLIGAGVVGANVLYFGGRAVAAGPHAAATLVVVGGFLLLVLGASVSWHKRTLLRRAERCIVPLPVPDANPDAADAEVRSAGETAPE